MAAGDTFRAAASDQLGYGLGGLGVRLLLLNERMPKHHQCFLSSSFTGSERREGGRF
ncbi:hypothetical protein SLEP1_g2517 [Rubroshorea leprosula]|uniref:Uncharacterized protein n=1 Tax=Rubroshorea leprosula TaxID=152421 RepID=A0AAV5HRL5_9ROSI|nr:hypothetical protein SLEP1_g2517 [Rubroshorea leprosula]